MGKGWATAPLGELLCKNGDVVELAPDKQYRELTVRLWGKGIVLRREVMGGEIGGTRRFRVTGGQFVLSRIDARHGAFGLVPPDLDGAVVSNDFPAFDLNERKLLPGFLGWLARTRQFVDLCKTASEGTTNRVRLKEDRFLAMRIPLPPLSEQRRIVAKINRLAEKSEEARGLRSRTATKVALIGKLEMTAVFERLLESYPKQQSFGEIAEVARGKFTHRPRNEPRFYGGQFPFIQINDISDSSRYIRQHSQSLNEDGLAISRMFPKGAVVIAITGATVGVTGILDFDSCFPDSIVGYVPKEGVVSSEFLFYALEHAKQKALDQATQTTQPNINLRILNTLTLSVPPIKEQRRIVAYLDDIQAKVDAIKKHQERTTAELDALVASILDRAFKGEL